MRKILFRAISIETNIFVYGYYRMSLLQEGDFKHTIHGDEDHAGLHCIKIETLGQFIGIKSVDGDDIYEGDIIDCGAIGEVVFNETGSFNVEGFYCSSMDYPTMAFSENYAFKVIGNIHENKNLLKG